MSLYSRKKKTMGKQAPWIIIYNVIDLAYRHRKNWGKCVNDLVKWMYLNNCDGWTLPEDTKKAAKRVLFF